MPRYRRKYRKKYTPKRRSSMGFKRRSFVKRRRYVRRKYPRVLRLPTTLQNTALKKFKYTAVGTTSIQIPVSGYGVMQAFIMNSLYKPDTINGLPPESIPALTELSGLYTYARVYGTEVCVTFSTASLTQVAGATKSWPVRCFIGSITPPLSPPNPTTLASTKSLSIWLNGNPRYTRHRLLQGDGDNPNIVRLRKFWKFRNLVNNKYEYMANANYDTQLGPTGASSDPISIIPVWIGAINENLISNVTAMTINVNITMTFYVRFWGMRVEIS